MQSDSSQLLVSTDNPDFIRIVESKLKKGESIVILLRYNNQGGNRDHFLVRNMDEFHQVLKKAHPKDALSVFFRQSFVEQGPATHELKERIKFLKKIVQDDGEGIVVIRLDTNDFMLDANNMKAFSGQKEIDEWFAQNPGVPVIVCALAFWEDNSDEMITAYVRDSDGQVHAGAY